MSPPPPPPPVGQGGAGRWHAPKCARMQEQAAKVAELRRHPFTFIHEVGVLVDEFALAAEDFLRARGLLGRPEGRARVFCGAAAAEGRFGGVPVVHPTSFRQMQFLFEAQLHREPGLLN